MSLKRGREFLSGPMDEEDDYDEDNDSRPLNAQPAGCNEEAAKTRNAASSSQQQEPQSVFWSWQEGVYFSYRSR